jgi:phage terminase large subunit-like protein
VPSGEVDGAVADVFERYHVCRFYCDPPKWETWIAKWAGEHGDKRVFEWWTNRRKPMAYAIRSFIGAMAAGEISHSEDPLLDAHIGNARQQSTNLVDEEGKPLWILRKERPDSPLKIDGAMAAVLAWEARNDAVAAGEGDVSYSLHFLGEPA